MLTSFTTSLLGLYKDGSLVPRPIFNVAGLKVENGPGDEATIMEDSGKRRRNVVKGRGDREDRDFPISSDSGICKNCEILYTHLHGTVK